MTISMEEQHLNNERSMRGGQWRAPWWYWRTWNYAKGSGSWKEAIQTTISLWRFKRRWSR